MFSSSGRKPATATLSDASLYDGTRAKPIKSLPNAPKPSKGAKEPAQ